MEMVEEMAIAVASICILQEYHMGQEVHFKSGLSPRTLQSLWARQ